MSETVPLVDMSAEPMTITAEGKTYKLPPLSMGDIAKAERWMVDQRVNLIIEKMSTSPIPDEVRALTVAEVACRHVLLNEILVSYEGRLRLLYHSMVRADPTVKWAFILNGMPAIPTAILVDLMYRLAGLARKESHEADPTTMTTPACGPDTKTGEPN